MTANGYLKAVKQAETDLRLLGATYSMTDLTMDDVVELKALADRVREAAELLERKVREDLTNAIPV